MTFSIISEFDPNHIAMELSDQLTNEELVKFIMTLDMCASDWSLTERLYKYFKNEHKIYKEQIKESDR